jgi:hypothetical protein
MGSVPVAAARMRCADPLVRFGGRGSDTLSLPVSKVYVGHKLGNTLNTQLDLSIRRYRARFCNGSA